MLCQTFHANAAIPPSNTFSMRGIVAMNTSASKLDSYN